MTVRTYRVFIESPNGDAATTVMRGVGELFEAYRYGWTL